MIENTGMIATVTDLSKTFGETRALDNVSLSIEHGKIYGLLGRNGAGKTTLMSMLTAQNFPDSGTVRVFDQSPYENASVLRRLCFIRENQQYPEEATSRSVLRSAALFFPNWDQELADSLAKEFEIPMTRTVKKLSRGQFSAVGVTLGLASRAELTFFDEPYLGLDAVARHIFYRRLAQDYVEHPRTMILSSHLIDEIDGLIEHVWLLDHGKLIVDRSLEAVQESAFRITGPTALVEDFLVDKMIVRREQLGGTSRITIFSSLSEAERRSAQAQHLEIEAASLQDVAISLATVGGTR